MKTITRQEALDKDLKKYYTGKPCKRGHIDFRFKSNGDCVQCVKEKRGTNKDKISIQENTLEKIQEINNILNTKNPNLKVIDLTNGVYTGYNSRAIVICKIHGKGTDFGNPWIPTLDGLRRKGCPKCSKRYTYTYNEAITHINKIINMNLKVTGFVNNKYSGVGTRCIVECKTHGKGCDFEKPWNPKFDRLQQGNGCPRCKVNGLKEKEDAINYINKLIKGKEFKFIDFVDNKYNGGNTRCIVECKTHGIGCNFNNSWNPTYNDLKRLISCPKCSDNYRKTTQEAILEINENMDLDKYRFIKFKDNEYNGAFSLCIVECKIHGKGSDFGNPWCPTFDALKRKKAGCPKCSGNYKKTTKEAINEMNKNINKNLSFIKFYDGFYTNETSRCLVKCKFHGNCFDFNKPWIPQFKYLKIATGCPFCMIEKHEINICLKNITHFNTKRNLYFITLKNLKNNELFYKIGVSTENGYKRRFNQLKKDNIEIIDGEEITTTNILALLTEYYILNNFKNNRKLMYHVLKHNKGGSECFDYDLTKILTLEEMIDNAINNFDILIKNLDLTEEESFNAKKEFLKNI